MVQRKYGALERKVIDIFLSEGEFNFQGKRYKVVKIDKPQKQGGSGEPKTDVYIKGEEIGGNDTIELKLSVKKRDFEFIENKITAVRMKDILGDDWEEIIQNASEKIANSFSNFYLIYPEAKYPTLKNSITLGWKAEITNKERTLSAKMDLTEQEIKDLLYKGINLPPDKRDAIVNGGIIPDSGIAEYIIETELDDIHTTQDVLSQMELIDDAHLGDAYLVFTANNYRTDTAKCDGARSLAVRVNWEVQNGKITPHFMYHDPLAFTGKEAVPSLLKALEELGKFHPEEMVPEEDVSDPSKVYKKKQ
ncbi:hypothetical protein [Neobacillus niacini]|uniref:hypothetical protein n=1 Tax=Neobacillus niacini TaxID=86668 RepID=UPI00204099AC|nr:hypothetical protein [Neobacillus niacini]MCM3692203.1 hypothetical protein [Neobacillus niacini]